MVRRALSSFQELIPFEISDLRFEFQKKQKQKTAVQVEESLVLLKFGKQVDRRQSIIATEATRPSGASTGKTDPLDEKCGSFLRQNSHRFF